MAGKYPGIVKTKLDGVNQFDYLTGKSEKSARDTFFYYTGATPSAVRYKNWKIYFTMEGSTGAAALTAGPGTYGWAQVQNIRRDPFEQAVGEEQKSVMSHGRYACFPEHRLYLQLEHAARWTATVAEGTAVLHRRSRRCRTQRATTSVRSWNRSRNMADDQHRANDREAGLSGERPNWAPHLTRRPTIDELHRASAIQRSDRHRDNIG